MRAWINSPLEWGEFGLKANAWFNSVRKEINSIASSIVAHTEGAPTIDTTPFPFDASGDWESHSTNWTCEVDHNPHTGLVCVRGLVKNVSGVTLTAPETIGQLPVGQRPPYRIMLSSFSSIGDPVRLDLYDNGQIILNSDSIVTNGWVALNFSFYAV